MFLYLSWHHSKESLFDKDWITKAKMIRCSAPLPEGLDNPVLDKMLEPVPYLVPSKEDEGGLKMAKAGFTRINLPNHRILRTNA